MGRKQGQRFPSDHRRYFRVMEDILDDPKLTSAPAEVFRFYIRLLAMLNRTKCRDGKITLDRYALNACTQREQRRHALSTARAGEAQGLYRMVTEGEQTTITVPKWAELQGIAPTKPRRRPNKTPPPIPTPTPTPIESARSGEGNGAEQPEDPLSMPPGYESPTRMLPVLHLNARATEGERAAWAEAVWVEVVAAAEDESARDGKTLGNTAKRILSARWNAYLRERDPDRRQFAREAHLRALQAAKDSLDREPPPDPSVPPEDDPLALLRAGANPNAQPN